MIQRLVGHRSRSYCGSMCGAGRRFLLRGQADVGDKESVPGPQKTKPFDRQLMDGQVRVAYVSDGSKPAGQSAEHVGRKRSSQDRGTRRSQITILSTSSRLT